MPMQRPLLYRGDRRTEALRVLIRAASEKGYNAPYAAGPRKWGNYTGKVVHHLLDIGWVEARYTGPRGGRRIHLTPMGKLVLELALKARNERELRPSLVLIGQNYGVGKRKAA